MPQDGIITAGYSRKECSIASPRLRGPSSFCCRFCISPSNPKKMSPPSVPGDKKVEAETESNKESEKQEKKEGTYSTVLHRFSPLHGD